MRELVQIYGPFALAFWFGGAFGFLACAFFAGSRILERQASTNMIYGTVYENQQGWQFAVRPGYDATDPWYKGFYRKPGKSWHPITALNWRSAWEEAEKDLAQYARMNELKEM